MFKLFFKKKHIPHGNYSYSKGYVFDNGAKNFAFHDWQGLLKVDAIGPGTAVPIIQALQGPQALYPLSVPINGLGGLQMGQFVQQQLTNMQGQIQGQ